MLATPLERSLELPLTIVDCVNSCNSADPLMGKDEPVSPQDLAGSMCGYFRRVELIQHLLCSGLAWCSNQHRVENERGCFEGLESRDA